LSFDAEVVSGKLPRKNIRLHDARPALVFSPAKLRVFSIGERSFIENQDFAEIYALIQKGEQSEYYSDFYQGATVVPRQFWFVNIVVGKYGIDTRAPTVQTSQRAEDHAKQKYSDVFLKGQVECEFLYQAATGSEVLPFGHLEFPLAMLPIEPSAGKYRLVSSEEAKTRGYIGVSSWLKNAERIWKEKRGEKAPIDVYGWLDYQHKLTNQSSRPAFKVLYNTSGTYLASCVVRNEACSIELDGTTITSNGVLADMTTCYFDASDEHEAWYLAAFLNARVIDMLIKPMQPKGDFGQRHIAKKVLELPMPRYNPKNETHNEMRKLALSSATKVKELLPSLEEKYDSIGKIRGLIKQELEDEMTGIDRLVKTILLSRRNVQKLDKLLQPS